MAQAFAKIIASNLYTVKLKILYHGSNEVYLHHYTKINCDQICEKVPRSFFAHKF